jgi:hypothetical protein
MVAIRLSAGKRNGGVSGDMYAVGQDACKGDFDKPYNTAVLSTK